MQLPAVIGDKLGSLGAAIESQSVRPFLLKTMLALLVWAMAWPYVLDIWFLLRGAFKRAPRMSTGGEHARQTAVRTLQERDQTQATDPQDPDPVRKQVLPHPQSGDVTDTPSSPPEIAPLTTLKQLFDYDGPGWGQGFAPARPPFTPPPFIPLRNRLLVCHDLAGGYGEDRLVQGGGYDRAYRMYDWGLIDIFVYFSHNLVTIPPAGWTNVAHKHGTRVLGTFITEWDAGYDICARLLESEATTELAAAKLTQIAMDHGFDGWLVNIENKVDPGRNVGLLELFLKSLTAQMRAAKGSSSSTVLWYDSVTVGGELAWQDCLNAENRAFFDSCDGIFTNYCWKDDYPSACALKAKARRFDVYMGIDTFGRGTWGGGGFDVDKALGKLRRAGVSAALFAPSWTMEDKTSGGGKVDPGVGGNSWREVEQEFGDVDAEFWAKIASAWHSPRAIPGPLQPSSSLLVANFGNGVGGVWRIQGEEVASFCVSPEGGEAMGGNGPGVATRKKGHIGGAFYDLSSQSLTPLAAMCRGRGGQSNAVKARLLGQPLAPPGGVNGTVGARYSFTQSYDGGSSLCFAGVLNEKAAATFPLFSCVMPLPAEPLEVRVTFSANSDSDIALVLLLDAPGSLGGRREVVLRGWGQQGAPARQPVFSKRVAYSYSKASYSPAREDRSGGAAVGGAMFAEEKLRTRIRALRSSGESEEDIWKHLRAERAAQHDAPHTAATNLRGGGAGGRDDPTSPSPPAASATPAWITRTYVVRDLRLDAARAVREIQVVCMRRRNLFVEPTSTEDAAADKAGQRGSSSSPAAGGSVVRLASVGNRGRGELRGVAGLAAFRACLGEVVLGPWRSSTPHTFGKAQNLRVMEVAFWKGETGDTLVDFSLAWEEVAAEGWGGKVKTRPLHWDLWVGESEGGWKWLGRAYGHKYRLQGLKIGGEGGKEALIIAVQETNAWGYRQPTEEWSRLQLCPP